jgi:hypothetical protein
MSAYIKTLTIINQLQIKFKFLRIYVSMCAVCGIKVHKYSYNFKKVTFINIIIFWLYFNLVAIKEGTGFPAVTAGCRYRSGSSDLNGTVEIVWSNLKLF